MKAHFHWKEMSKRERMVDRNYRRGSVERTENFNEDRQFAVLITTLQSKRWRPRITKTNVPSIYLSNCVDRRWVFQFLPPTHL